MVRVKCASTCTEGVLHQWLAAVIVNFLAVSYGVACGWPSSLIPQLQRSETPVSSLPLSSEDSSWIGGFLTVGGLTATPFSDTLVERFGRKIFGYAASVTILLSALLAMFATNHAYIFASFYLTGVHGAMGTFLVSIYVTEISSVEVRGALASLLIFSINIGILLGFLAGPFIPYRLFVIFIMVFPLFFLVSFFFMPETPVYLVRKRRIDEAIRSLMFFRGNNKILVDQELCKLQSQMNDPSQQDEKVRLLQLFRDRANFKGMIIALSLLSGQQFSGIIPLLNNAMTIFKMSNSSLSPEFSAIVIGVIQVCSSYLSIILMERAGRRILILISSAGMAACYLIFAAFIYLLKYGQDVSTINWIPTTTLSICMICYCLGMGPVPYVVASEIFRINVVSLANTVGMLFFWVAAFIIVKIFGCMNSIGIENCFLLLCIFCIGIFIFAYFVLPETKGRKREDIVAELAGNANQLIDGSNEI